MTTNAQHTPYDAVEQVALGMGEHAVKMLGLGRKFSAAAVKDYASRIIRTNKHAKADYNDLLAAAKAALAYVDRAMAAWEHGGNITESPATIGLMLDAAIAKAEPNENSLKAEYQRIVDEQAGALIREESEEA